MKKLISILALSVMTFAAQASTSTYSDFDSWTDDVAGIVTVDTFNSYDFYNFGDQFKDLGTAVTLGGNKFSIDSGSLFGVAKNYSYDDVYHTSNYLDWEAGAPNTLTITLSGSTQAFGIKVGQFYGTSGTYQILLGNGDAFTVLGGSSYTFFGAISTSAFNTIQITANSFPNIDNLSLGPVTAVPEPESYAMLLAGLGLIGAMARRRKQKTVA